MYSTKNTKANKSLIIHIVLLVFLGKIWMWPWIYQTAYSLKTIKPNDYYRRPGGQLLMYMFIPFYFMYWFYKSGKILSNYASRNGVRIEIAGLCCVLSLFSRKAACIIMQMECEKLEAALIQKEAEAKDQKEEKNATAKESNKTTNENVLRSTQYSKKSNSTAKYSSTSVKPKASENKVEDQIFEAPSDFIEDLPEDAPDLEYVDVTCPFCKSELSFTKDMKIYECPYCGKHIKK